MKRVAKSIHPWTTISRRPGVTVHDGVLTLVRDDQGPEDALVADLLLVADALEAADIDMLLIRTAKRRPVLVVDEHDRERASTALRTAFHDEPFYAQRRRGPLGLIADVGLPGRGRALTLFRPRITPGGALGFGREAGVRLEFWHWTDGVVTAPSDNALTRRVIPREEVSIVPVQRYGREWRTIGDMFTPHASEFTGEIDMVFSWVDGSSSEFQRARAQRMHGYVVGDGDDGPARFRQVDELRYALRSVNMYAPWVRRIFIATDSEQPVWLADHPKVTVVRSEEFFADTAVLPTHNSHAVESQLHHIDGLSEYFLYSNDDMFFGRPVAPELFFTPGGVSQFVESPVRIGTGSASSTRSGHDNAARINRELLRDAFGIVITRDLSHCAAPLRRSVMGELETRFPQEFDRTAAARFRSATDVSVTNSLYHYFALATGRAVVTTRPHVEYVQTTLAEAIPRMRRLVARRDADMFCLNDGGMSELPEDVRVLALRECLETYFPIRAPWEVAETDAESADDVRGVLRVSGEPESAPSAGAAAERMK